MRDGLENDDPERIRARVRPVFPKHSFTPYRDNGGMKQNLAALDGVEIFLRVAELRSFRKAAAALGMKSSAVGESMQALESRLGVALFTRKARSVILTEAGERFLARAKPAFEELVLAGQSAQESGQQPAGLLRLTVPRAAVPMLLDPLVASFCRVYPEIEVEIAVSEELVDLAEGGYDAGVRIGQLMAADMVAVALSRPFRMVVVGSPGYFADRSQPESPHDLQRHACMRLRRAAGTLARWSFIEDDRNIEISVSGPLIANDFRTILGAAMEGIGLAQVPAPVAANALAEGKLVQVLEDFAPMAPGVFLYYPSRRQMSPKLRAFLDHVKLAASAM